MASNASNEASGSTMRITSAGKMKAYVQQALKVLQENPEGTLTLHTLPAKHTDGQKQGTVDLDRLQPCTTTIPRLISVVEIIKREFIGWLEEAHSTRLVGLHQYNNLGRLEDLPATKDATEDVMREEDLEQSRRKALKDALEGKNHVKLKHTPYMQVTLSMSAQPALVETGATYQPPVVRKVSKSAKARARKRERKGTEGGGGQAAEFGEDVSKDAQGGKASKRPRRAETMDENP